MANRWILPLACALSLGALTISSTYAGPYPPIWASGNVNPGTSVDDGDPNHGGPIHHAPAAWPSEPTNPADCGTTCGQWKPYTRFQTSIGDPRVQDPSNGGTSPQNYVNISSSCIDRALPSVYYNLKQVDAGDPSKDVIMFRWRVEQIANTYATGPNAGTYGATSPWNSALWTVLFDIDGSGYRDLAAHLNGSSGSPSKPIDMLAGIYGRIPTQSISYEDDPANIKLLGHNPTAFVDGTTNRILNFNNSLTPTASWPNGSSETVWDYGTTRARKVSTRSCTEYFVDYQIPVALLDATPYGGPKVDRSTPISMLFCTANSLNNPFQKDCALNRRWIADPSKPAPFGDYISFDQEQPYSQPIVREVRADAPAICDATYALSTTVQDTLYVDSSGTVRPSIQSVEFWYYHDVNGDGVSNDGSTWTFAGLGTQVGGTLNRWQASWDSRSLPKGRYLIGVQALDDGTKVDDDVAPSSTNNRVFSYVTSNAHGEVYIDDTWRIDTNFFPTHSPTMTPSAAENWYGNPLITGAQVATAGVDLALNQCGVSPSVSKTATPSSVAVGETVSFAISIANPAANTGPITVSRIDDVLPGDFAYVNGTTSGDFGTGNPTPNGQELRWEVSPAVSIPAGESRTLNFHATASNEAGTYNNLARATTSFGVIESDPVAIVVDSARLSLSKTPDRYIISPDGTTQLMYTLAWSNDSQVALSAARIEDVLPADISYVACSGGTSCGNSGGTVTWQLGNVAGGASGSVTLTVTADTGYSSSTLLNTASFIATAPDGNPVSREARSTIAVDAPAPAFALSKTASSAQIAPGGSVTWSLRYENYGTGSAQNVTLEDDLPEGFTYSSCSVAGSTHFTGCTHSGGIVTFHNGSGGGVTVPADASGQVAITATAAAAPFTFPNPAINVGTLTWNGGNVSADVPVGVSGQSCEAAYYLKAGGALSLDPPPVSQAGTFGATRTGVSLTFTGEPAAEMINLEGKSLSLRFYMQAGSANTTLTSTVQSVAPNNDVTTIATFSTSQSLNTAAWYTFSTGNFGAGTSLPAGHRLRLVFTGDGNSLAQQLNIYFDGNVTVDGASIYANSHASICSGTAPTSLSLAKTVDKPSVDGPVETLTYTLSYANNGGTTATNVTLIDALPAGMTNCQYESGANNWLSCADNSGHSFTIGSVTAGTSGTLRIRADSPSSTTPGQQLTNTATIDSDQTDPLSRTAVTLIGAPGAGGGSPILQIEKRADTSYIGPNQNVGYSLIVTNVGDGASGAITVADAIPATAYFSYVASSISGGISRSDASAPNLSWTIDSLAPGGQSVLGYQMRTSATGLPGGATELDNTATLSDADYCTGDPKPVACTSNTVTVTINGSPKLTLSKSASPTTGLSPGDELTWTLTLRNDGSAAANEVVIIDPVVAGTQFVSSADGSFDAVNNRVRFDIGTLAAGEQVQRSFVARIGTLDAGEHTLTNVATASAGNAAQTQAQTDVTANAAPVLVLEKSAPSSIAFPSARLAVDASNATDLDLDAASHIDVGASLRIGTTFVRVLSKSGNRIEVDAPVNASAGTALQAAATFTLSYRNDGDAASAAVTLTDPLPTGWLFISAADNPDGSAPSTPSVGANGEVAWTLGGLAPGASGSLQLVAVPTQSGLSTNVATLSDSGYCTGDPKPDGCTASATTAVGGITVAKRTETPVVSVGPDPAIARYVITVSNSLATDVTNVSVSDTLPAGFSYRAGTGSPAPDTVEAGQPSWTGLSVPAQGSIELSFEADVAADTGTATYDNEAGAAATGVAVTPFDALSTSAEDVTVLGDGSYVLEGWVFRDVAANGTRDEGDDGFGSVRVEIDDGTNNPYVLHTDGFGYFRQVITEPPATWTVMLAGGSNATILSGFELLNAYPTAPSATFGGGGQPDTQSVYFGYVPQGSSLRTVSGSVFDDDGSGAGTASNGVLDGDETGTNGGGANVVVLDSGSEVLAVVPVDNDGSWSATVPQGTDYKGYLTTSSPTVGSTVTAAPLYPTGWSGTGSTPGVTASFDVAADVDELDIGIVRDGPDVYTTIDLPAQLAPNATTHALIRFGNIGLQPGADIEYRVSGLPTSLAGVQCTGATCNYDATNGEVVITGLPTSLSPQQHFDVVLAFEVPASGALTVNSHITTSSANDPPANNDASDTASVGAAPHAEVATTIVAPAHAITGQTVVATARFHAIGDSASSGSTYAIEGVPAGASTHFGATACTVASADGALSGCGLPSALAPGETVQVTITYAAPSDGSVTLTSVVDATNDSDSGNNRSSATTRVGDSGEADVTTQVAPPATANAGETVSVPLSYANLGPTTAQEVGYFLMLSPGLEDVVCAGVTCTYDAGSGVVTASGLPTDLSPGETAGFVVRYTAPADGPVVVLSRVSTSTTESNADNNEATALTRIIDGDNTLLQVVKTAYLGHDAGAGCPGIKQLVYVNKERTPIALTWCFVVTNTGKDWLDQPRFTDAGLGIAPADQSRLLLRSGSLPLAPGATAVWYVADTRETSLENFVSLSMTATDEAGTPIDGAPPVTGEDSVAAIFGYVYDPPFGVKTGEVNGATTVRWTMVWVNDNVVTAEGVLITDPPPEGMTMIGSPTCTPYGTTTVSVCAFDPPGGGLPRGRVRVLADIGPDFGVTVSTIDSAANRLEIAFDVSIDDPAASLSYENQGTAEWTQPSEAEPFIALTYDRSQLSGMNPDTPPSDVDPTNVPPSGSRIESGGSAEPPKPIPVSAWWALVAAALGLLAVARRSLAP